VEDLQKRKTAIFDETGRRPITSPARPRPKTPFSEDRRRWAADHCYSVFDEPRRAQFEAANPPSSVARPGGSCLMRRRTDMVGGLTEPGRAASLGHV